MHVLVGFNDGDTTKLNATYDAAFSCGGGASNVVAPSYSFVNVFAAKEGSATVGYSYYDVARLTIWDPLIDYQLQVMTWHIQDIDVNFVNEMMFDIIYANPFIYGTT